MYRILELNPQLQCFSGDIDLRMQLYRDTKRCLVGEDGKLIDFANAHEYYGFHRIEGGWVYREWAPSAHQLYLTGDFNNWQWLSHPLTNMGDGNWELMLEGEGALWDGCKVKTIVDANMTRTEHIPLYARRVVQDPATTAFCAEVVDESKPFKWTDSRFRGEDSLYIYEAHLCFYIYPPRKSMKPLCSKRILQSGFMFWLLKMIWNFTMKEAHQRRTKPHELAVCSQEGDWSFPTDKQLVLNWISTRFP